MFLLPQCLLFLMLLRLSWFYLEAEVSLAIEACQLSPYKSRVWCTSYLYFPVSVLFCVPWTSLIGTGGFLVSDFCIIYELKSWSNYWQYQFPCQTDKFVPLSWTQPARQILGHRSESGPKNQTSECWQEARADPGRRVVFYLPYIRLIFRVKRPQPLPNSHHP